jgi:hypothetical protein
VPVIAAAPIEPAGFDAVDATDPAVAFPTPFPFDPAPTP